MSCRWHSVASVVDGVCVSNFIVECIGDRERLDYKNLLIVSDSYRVGF